jgi:hypothetical protein
MSIQEFELGWLYHNNGLSLEQAKAQFVKTFPQPERTIPVCKQGCPCKDSVYVKICTSKDKCEKRHDKNLS